MAGTTTEKIKHISELIKLEYSLFILPFAYIGMLYAAEPTLAKFVLITIALIAARGAAFAVNRYAGLKYDAENPKKKKWRSTALYSKMEILTIAAFFALAFLASAYELNTLAFELAPVVLVLIALEPYTKRYTAHRHITMGFIIGLGIIGGYIGMAGAFPDSITLYVLLLGYTFFSAGSDIIYAIEHSAFDKSHGLKTYPVKYGKEKALGISKYMHYWAAALFIEFGALSGSPVVLFGGLGALLIFYFEHKSVALAQRKPLAGIFFCYNAAVSLLMLASVIIFMASA